MCEAQTNQHLKNLKDMLIAKILAKNHSVTPS